MGRRALGLLGSLVAVFLIFFAIVRPWYLGWGATEEEARRPLPGDEIIPNAATQETRAITINAPLQRVWPWVAQIGQDRGGFYSYDLLENLVGCEMPTVDVLRPTAQAWQLGDRLWMYPSGKGGGTGFATLRTYLPGRALGFSARAMGSELTAPDAGSWTFVLEPVSPGRTRLLIRGRGAPAPSLLGAAFDRTVFEPVHFVMERRMMIGIKQLAETGSRTWFENHLRVGLWVIGFGLLVTAAVRALHRKYGRRALTGFVAGCFLFQVLTLIQPGVLPGLLLVTGLAMLILQPGARRRVPA